MSLNIYLGCQIKKKDSKATMKMKLLAFHVKLFEEL